MLCLLIEGEGIAHGKHPHGLIACGDTPVEGWFCKSRSQGMIGQLRRRRRRRLQRLQRTAMKDGAPRFTRLSVDDRTNLRMSEHVAPSGHVSYLSLRLMQQATVQDLVQGRESDFFFEIGHLAQVPKGDAPVEDGSCRQKCKGMRRESIQSGADNFSHTGGEEPTHYCLMLHSCRKVKCPPSLLVRAQGKYATLDQDLECFYQIERLSLCFNKQPLAKAFQVC